MTPESPGNNLIYEDLLKKIPSSMETRDISELYGINTSTISYYAKKLIKPSEYSRGPGKYVFTPPQVLQVLLIFGLHKPQEIGLTEADAHSLKEVSSIIASGSWREPEYLRVIEDVIDTAEQRKEQSQT